MMDTMRGKRRMYVDRTARGGVFAVLATLLLFSCGPGPTIQTIEWEPDGDGFVQYSTNDKQYLDTVHYMPLVAENENPMTTVTATVKKVSGSSVMGFGIIYCYQDENNYYRLLITTDGHYAVAKMVGGTYTALVSWASSASLNTGMGVTNDIGVTQNPLHTFTVTFNTQTITSFADASFTGGLAGPCIGIGSSSNESFPSVPEDARFKMTAPVVYP
jgi:hypothetical protein